MGFNMRKKNIALIGYMGTGKTTIGKRLARKLGLTFVDTDAYIEKQQGKKISQIFEEDGEPINKHTKNNSNTTPDDILTFLLSHNHSQSFNPFHARSVKRKFVCLRIL